MRGRGGSDEGATTTISASSTGGTRRGYNNGGGHRGDRRVVVRRRRKGRRRGRSDGPGRRDRDIAVAASVIPRGTTGSLAEGARRVGAAPPGSPCRGRRRRSSRGHHDDDGRRETTTASSSGGTRRPSSRRGGAGVGIPGPSGRVSRRYDPADAIAGAVGMDGGPSSGGGAAAARAEETAEDIRRRSRTDPPRRADRASGDGPGVGRGDRRAPSANATARGGPAARVRRRPPPGGPRSPVFSPPHLEAGGECILRRWRIGRRSPSAAVIRGPPLDQLSEREVRRTTRRRSHSQSKEVALLRIDEFQVTDVADAMILTRFFGEIWRRGVVVATTSNGHPSKLYEGGGG